MKILNFGSLNIDHVYQVGHIVREGETIRAKELRHFAGGKGLNQSIALARAGAQVFHAGCVGEDGDHLCGLLRENGVDTRYIKTVNTPTGNAVIQVDGHGQNSIVVYGGANHEIGREQIERTLSDFSPGDWLLLQNEISEIPYLIELGCRKGLKIALNPSPFDRGMLGLPLENLSLLFVNEVEAAQMTGFDGGDVEEIVAQLGAVLPGSGIVLTLGERGSVYLHDGQAVYQRSFPAKAVDTTAAGDTFTGYFLAAVLQGQTPQTAMELASRASALAVSRPGAYPSIPWKEELQAN